MASTTAVFRTAELVENILVHLPPLKLFTIQRVNKMFKDTVKSANLQHRMYLDDKPLLPEKLSPKEYAVRKEYFSILVRRFLWAFHLQSISMVHGDTLAISLIATEWQIWMGGTDGETCGFSDYEVSSVYGNLRPGSWLKIGFQAPAGGIKVDVTVDEYDWDPDDDRHYNPMTGQMEGGPGQQEFSVELTGRVTLLKLFKAALGEAVGETQEYGFWDKIPHPSTFSERQKKSGRPTAGRRFINSYS